MKETLEERLMHARYEYDMARHCIKQLEMEQTQADWNAFLAAFAVYFRNLEKNFLKGDGDQETIKAKNYIKRFSPASAAELKDDLDRLHWEVLHLSGRRTSKNEEKLGLGAARKLMVWLQANIEQFERELENAAYKALWKNGPSGSNSDIKQHRGWTGSPGPLKNKITHSVHPFDAVLSLPKLKKENE